MIAVRWTTSIKKNNESGKKTDRSNFHHLSGGDYSPLRGEMYLYKACRIPRWGKRLSLYFGDTTMPGGLYFRIRNMTHRGEGPRCWQVFYNATVCVSSSHSFLHTWSERRKRAQEREECTPVADTDNAVRL